MKLFFKKYAQFVQGTLILILLVAAVVLLIRLRYLDRTERYPIRELDAGWSVMLNGEPYSDAPLSQIQMNGMKPGDTFVLTRTLDKNDGLPSACIYFRGLHTAVTARLDDEIIYSAGNEQYAAGRLIGRMLCYVDLPADHDGRTLTIEMTAGEPNAFYGLGPFYYGTEQDLFIRFIQERKTALFVALFLCVFGVIQLLWIPLVLQDSDSNTKLLFSALTTLVLGVYLMGYYNLFDLFTDVPNANTLLEYLALYLLAAVMSGYIASTMTGRMRKLYQIFLAADLCFVAVALILHATNLVHFTRFLLVGYAISFTEAIPFMVSVVRGWIRRTRTYYDHLELVAERILAIGFFAYVICSFIDAVIFSYVRASGGQEATVFIPFIIGGSLIFSITICMHYFLQGVINLRAETVRQTLHVKAYSDPLTGLSNRSECEQLLNDLAKEKRRFAIINMDLDYLKELNDTRGHAEGDRMLSGFGEILRTVFDKSRLIGRMGGDEFIVVLTDETCEQADVLTEKLRDALVRANQNERVFQYSVSYGIAQSNELGDDLRAHDIYMLADQRMYNMKRRRHSAAAGKEAGHAFT